MQVELFPAGELLFEVTADGHEYRIYSNGRVEGFGDTNVKVINHYFRLLIDRLQQAEASASCGVADKLLLQSQV
ncbi:MAG: hypothetical protein WBS19_13575 [Candidatus Korobacteraceae bacterium]